MKRCRETTKRMQISKGRRKGQRAGGGREAETEGRDAAAAAGALSAMEPEERGRSRRSDLHTGRARGCRGYRPATARSEMQSTDAIRHQRSRSPHGFQAKEPSRLQGKRIRLASDASKSMRKAQGSDGRRFQRRESRVQVPSKQPGQRKTISNRSRRLLAQLAEPQEDGLRPATGQAGRLQLRQRGSMPCVSLSL